MRRSYEEPVPFSPLFCQMELKVSVNVERLILVKPFYAQAAIEMRLKAIFQSQLDHAFGLSESEVAG
jgi:hypothetical protein